MTEGQKFPDVVELNVGGTNITTSLSTLTKYPDSMLAAMFSGRQPLSTDRQGRYFVDCDGDIFKMILEYLRFGSLPPESFALKVYEYARYFCLQDLIDALQPYKEVTNIKEMLNLSGCLNWYGKMKCNIVSNAYNMNFSPITVTLICSANEPSSFQQRCLHNFDKVFSFWYLSENLCQLDWMKAMMYELDKEGIQCHISKQSARSNCAKCYLRWDSIVRVSFK